MLQIRQVPILEDNYAYLLHQPDAEILAVVDPGDAAPVLAAAPAPITHILLTHHHADHIAGAAAIAMRTGAQVIAAAADARRIPGISHPVADGDMIDLGGSSAEVLAVPGHTRGHIAFWFPGEAALFCGDALFTLGCGRLFEGSPAEMWESLKRLRELPPETRIYCGHEYTLDNAPFALDHDPGNGELAARIAEARDLREQRLPTVPSTLGQEIATNPFLRADLPALAEAVGLSGHPAPEVFAELRRRRDRY